jgi:hypothetical protein
LGVYERTAMIRLNLNLNLFMGSTSDMHNYSEKSMRAVVVIFSPLYFSTLNYSINIRLVKEVIRWNSSLGVEI